jgi:hypothetical protein
MYLQGQVAPGCYSYAAWTCTMPLRSTALTSANPNLPLGCTSPECFNLLRKRSPHRKYLNGDDIEKTTSPTRFMHFHNIDTARPFAKKPVAAAELPEKLDPCVTMIPPRNLLVAGLPAPVRLCLLVIVPPIVPTKEPLPPLMACFGFEVEADPANLKRVEYSTAVETPYYCQVYEPSLDVVYHVRMVTPIGKP